MTFCTIRKKNRRPRASPKNPQVPHTSRKVVLSLNNLRCKRSSIPPQNTRPDTPEQTQQGPCDLSHIRPPGSQEQNPEVPASTRDEAHFHCTKPKGVPRGLSQIHSIPDFSEAPEKLPDVTCMSRGNPWFPATT